MEIDMPLNLSSSVDDGQRVVDEMDFFWQEKSWARPERKFNATGLSIVEEDFTINIIKLLDLSHQTAMEIDMPMNLSSPVDDGQRVVDEMDFFWQEKSWARPEREFNATGLSISKEDFTINVIKLLDLPHETAMEIDMPTNLSSSVDDDQRVVDEMDLCWARPEQEFNATGLSITKEDFTINMEAMKAGIE